MMMMVHENYILEEQVHTILQYEDLNESYLNKFFGVNTPHCNIEPMNIDYEKYPKYRDTNFSNSKMRSA